MRKLLLTAEQEDHAKVETQEEFTSSLTKKVSQIPLASSMSPITWTILEAALQSINAKIALGLHAQWVRLAKTNVGLWTTSTIMYRTTTASQELRR